MNTPLPIWKLANLAGVSVKTLRHYDEIWLLIPAFYKESNYRFYTDHEALLLQQILFYKALWYSLSEIKEILYKKDFNIVTSLRKQKKLLKSKEKNLWGMIETIDNTLLQLINTNMIDYTDLYKWINPQWRDEAINKYGEDALNKSEKKLTSKGKQGFQDLVAQQKENRNSLFENRNLKSDNQEAQILIAKHYDIVTQFRWKKPSKEEYLWLAQHYIHDERFITFDGKVDPKFASFLSEWMAYFVKVNELV